MDEIYFTSMTGTEEKHGVIGLATATNLVFNGKHMLG